jgi:hypothetical protein
MIKKLFSSQLRINMASGVATTVINTVVMAVGYFNQLKANNSDSEGSL